MELPKSLRKVKKNKVVVFEDDFEFGVPCNAICLDDEGNLLFLHTDYYHTTGEVKFYGERTKS